MLTALTTHSSKAAEITARCISGRISYAFLQFHRNHSSSGTHSTRRCLDLHTCSKGDTLHQKWRTPPSFLVNSREILLRAPLYAENKEEEVDENPSGEDKEDQETPIGGSRGGRDRGKGKEVVGRHLIKDRTKIIPVETSIRYIKSAAYKETYGDAPFWVPYRRNFPGQFAPKKTRKTCIRQGQLTTGNPCPVCRDEYLVVHYLNIELLKQFISPHNGEILGYFETGVCRTQHEKIVIAIDKAKDFGLITFDVPFREYDYKEYEKLYASY